MTRSLRLPTNIGAEAIQRVVEGTIRGFRNALGEDYDESIQSPNYWDNPSRRRVRAVVWHITDGGFVASRDWLCNPASQASANDLINRDGVVWSLVPGRLAPWTNGPLCNPNRDFAIPRQAEEQAINPNWWSYTIESVGESTYGRAGALSQPQIASLILRTAQAVTEYKLSADTQHILRHASFDRCTRSGCPGYAAWEMVSWVEAVREVASLWRGW